MSEPDGSRCYIILQEALDRLSSIRAILWLQNQLRVNPESASNYPEEIVRLVTEVKLTTPANVRGILKECRRLGCVNPPPDGEQISPALGELSDALRGLKAVLPRLRPYEDQQNNPSLDQCLKEAQQQVDTLTGFLEGATQQRNLKIGIIQAQIDANTHQASKIREHTAERNLRIKSECEEEMEVIGSASERIKEELRKELEELQRKFDRLLHEHQGQERILKKEKRRPESQLKELQNNYQEAMDKYEATRRDLAEQVTSSSSSLERQSSHADQLRLRYDAVIRDRRNAFEIAQRERLDARRQAHAATLIQAVWRGHVTRQSLKPRHRRGKRGQRRASQTVKTSVVKRKASSKGLDDKIKEETR